MGKIKAHPALDRYLAIKREFRQLSETAAEMVVSQSSGNDLGDAWQMSERASLPEGVCIWGKQLGRAALACVIEKGVSTLTKGGCYSVDEDRYKEEYLDVTAIDECAESGMVMGELETLESDEYRRESERQGRTARWGNLWRGGTLGGGIKGALKGALKAEIMNVGGALASGAINKIGRERSRGKMLEESERLFGFFRLELAEAVRTAIMDNVDGYVRCLNEHLGEAISGTWPEADSEAARGILGNLNADRIPKELRPKAIRELIRLDPFSAESYDWIYRNDARSRKEVEALADYFCVEVGAIKEARQEKADASEKRKREAAKRRREKREAARKEDEAKRTAFGKVWPSVADMEAARASRNCFFECVRSLVAAYSAQDGFAGDRLKDKKCAKIQAVFETLPDERILWLLDTSTWYNANYGLLVTDKGLRWKNRDASISKMSCLCWQAFGAFEKGPRIMEDDSLRLAEGAKVDMDVNINWKEKWLPVIVSFWNFWREGTFEKVAEEMSVPLAEQGQSETVGTEDKHGPQSLENIILKAISDVGGGLYCKPNIPEKKLINAKVAMSVQPGETVVALLDTTFFGSAKTGAVLTDWGIRWANDWATDSVRTAMSWKELCDSKPFSAEECELKLAKDAVIGTAGGGMSAADLAKVIESVTL